MGLIGRLIRAPALHFMVLGGLLFLANGWWQDWTVSRAATAPEALVISSGQIAQLRQDFITQKGVPPSEPQLRAVIEDAIDEEILFRQALEIGLDRSNDAVRHRLVQIARFVTDDPDQDDEALLQLALDLGLDRSDMVVRRQLATMMRLVAANAPMVGEVPPDDNELEAFLAAHPDRFMEPWRIRLSHVFVNDDKRRRHAEADASALLDRIRAAGLGPDDAPETGDPFLLGHHLTWQTRQGLGHILGDSFAEAAMDLKPGVWSGPIRSTYGWHLVWAHDVAPAAVPELAKVRDRVLRAVLEARRDWRERETLKSMRAGYSIRVEAGESGADNDG